MGTPNAMRLLVDSDIFCKLGVSGLLQPALAALGLSWNECGRLAALPHMLRRGKLPKLYGAAACELLIPSAESMPVAPLAGTEWLDQLVGVDQIDAGEAQLFAASCEHTLVIVTGDKRALRAVAKLPGLCMALPGRIITLEAILITLCQTQGVTAVRRSITPLASDGLVKVCFSAGNPDPEGALRSYLAGLEVEVAPLVLWQPGMGIDQ